MALRTPPALDPSSLSLDQLSPGLEWYPYGCELITPMFGGGVVAGVVDMSMPIRASAIRGQLRSWWRMLAKQVWKLGDWRTIREQEIALWGGLGNPPTAGNVWLRVSTVENSASVGLMADIVKKEGEGVKYVAFSTKATGRGPEATPEKELALPGLRWRLELAFTVDPNKADPEVCKAQVTDALRWWACFGGVGARTRRGMGAVHVKGLRPVSAEEAQAAGCKLVFANQMVSADALKTWEQSVVKLRNFRQAPGTARNSGSQTPGRSFWPEPDAIRRLTGSGSKGHDPVHKAGNQFPRAAFGMPIIFHFRGKLPGEPRDYSLQPHVNGALAERMSSPLILRPYPHEKGWIGAALLLPTDHLKLMRIKLPNDEISEPGGWWNPAQAQYVPLLQGRSNDPLEAFLKFFAE